MEKICEFCTALKPVVYCKADGAYLCLSCDARVHSANALSNRHLRTLLCDSCRCRPAYARCVDHRTFFCHFCDKSQHGASSQHQKRVLSSYMGCPSAKDFASLWGFQLDRLDNSDLQMGGCSSTSHVTHSTLASNGEFNFGSNSQQTVLQTLYEGQQQQQNSSFILQQILDLKRLQLSEANKNSPALGGQKQMDLSTSTLNSMKKLDGNFNDLQHSQNLDVDLEQQDCILQDLTLDSLPFPFAQQENLPLSSTASNALLGESFWECKSPAVSSQLWSQNMQDLGVCDDIVCHDDFNIPDVDITFCNFEELFGVDQDPMRVLNDDKVASCSSMDKDMSVDKSGCNNGRASEDTSMASSVYMTPSLQGDKDKGLLTHAYDLSGEVEAPPRTLRPSHSVMSFSNSRLSAESNGAEYIDSGFPTYTTIEQQSCHSPDPDGAHSEARENAMMRYKEKKKARLHVKQTRHTTNKARSNIRKRGKGQLAKTAEGYDSDTFNSVRSY